MKSYDVTIQMKVIEQYFHMVPGSILSGGYVSCRFSTPFMTIYAILNDFVYTTFNNFDESIFRITKDQREKNVELCF